MSYIAAGVAVGTAAAGYFGSRYAADEASDASERAAADQYRKEQQAISGLTDAGNQYAGNVNSLSGAYDPYVKAGRSSLDQLMKGLGLGGQGGSAEFANAYRSLPGYQSGLDTGTNAAIRGMNAGGRLQSGATLKALQRFGSDYEDQRSGDYLSRLMAMQGQGLDATGRQVGVGMQAESGRLGALQTAYGGAMGSAKTIGQGDIASAQAQQTGMQNAINSGSSVIGSYLGGRRSGASSGSSPMPSYNSIYGTFAEGGRPPAGQPSIVGEQGPEIFVPDQSGTVLPNGVLQALMSDETSYPSQPGQQYAANTSDDAARKALFNLRQAIGVGPTMTGVKATDDVLKQIEEALKLAPGYRSK